MAFVHFRNMTMKTMPLPPSGVSRCRLRTERRGLTTLKNVRKTVLVAHSPEQMFALVDRVEDYPQFLPWCGGATILERSAHSVEAELQIAYRGIRQSFVTRNTSKPTERIDMNFVRGPFRSLAGAWFFIRVGNLGCRIEFRLDYEFASGVLEKLVGSVFDSIADSLVDAFVAARIRSTHDRSNARARGRLCVAWTADAAAGAGSSRRDG
jgi:ribosome-associated toxin RatA of RatAB toxin-antitoxin module